jgi:hypothetical protein
LQPIKLLDASQFRLCLLYGNGVGGPGYCALQSAPSVFFVQKRTAVHGFAQYSSPFYILKPLGHYHALPVSRKFICRLPLWPSREKAEQPSPQAWLFCKN